ncbi:MAG: hypothetical protein ABSE64_16605 [Vulcanimicrobiaceae bacterium]
MKAARVRNRVRGHNIEIEIVGTDVRQRLTYSTGTLLPLLPLSSSPHILEFFELCLALYAADRLLTRSSRFWAREIEIQFPFSRLQLWRDNRPHIEELFFRATGDHISLIPEQRAFRDVHADSRLQSFHLDVPQETTVALLSDGLDSFCGAFQALDSGGNVAFVSLITNAARQARIARIRAWLEREYAGRVHFHEVGFHLLRPPRAQERTQRFRTILAIAAGLTVCAAYGSDRLIISENGIGILNLPVPHFQMRHESSQVLHPGTLPLWSLVASRTTGAANIHYPNRFQTKSEMCRKIPVPARQLIAATSSCDSPRRTSGSTDCGRCSSCVLRRIALENAGLASYDKKYLDGPVGLSKFDADDILRFHARLLKEEAKGGDWQALSSVQDTLEASIDPAAPASERAHLIAATVDLLKRHANEVLSFDR